MSTTVHLPRSSVNAESDGFKIFSDLRIDKTIVDGKPVFKTVNINKSTTKNDAPVVYGDSIDLLVNTLTYEPILLCHSKHPRTNPLCRRRNQPLHSVISPTKMIKVFSFAYQFHGSM
jgi:hypothetical protein